MHDTFLQKKFSYFQSATVLLFYNRHVYRTAKAKLDAPIPNAAESAIFNNVILNYVLV